MQVAYSVREFLRQATPGTIHAATLGNFDGVHMGHRELVRMTCEKAAMRHARSVVVTFDPHPVHILRNIERPELLTPLPRKLELLDKLGVEAVLVLAFTRDMALMEPGDFIYEYLVEGLSVADIVIGYNFALGKNRKGNLVSLRRFGGKWGFEVSQVKPVIINGETVSSTLIREQVRCGNVGRAEKLLGRPYSAEGKVVRGAGRGTGLGFPTANVDYGHTLLPPLGAYATWVELLPAKNGGRAEGPWPAMTSVGTNPTFGGSDVTLEVHLLDFTGDLYGKIVRVHFMNRLRAEIRFNGITALCERLAHDAREAARVLAAHPLPAAALFHSMKEET